MTPEENKNTCTDKSCSSGGCGNAKGMCSGIALMIGLISSILISSITSIPALQLPVMFIVSTLLVLGVYPSGGRWFKKKHTEQKEL